MTRRSSEPACRVCGCTEYNACDEGCSWVKVRKGEKPLCSACAGTVADLIQVMSSVRGTLGKLLPFSVDPDHTVKQMRASLNAASARCKARLDADARNPDPAWGDR